MPDWVQSLLPLVGTAIGAIGLLDYIRKSFAQRLDRQAMSGNRRESREARDWASLDGFREDQAKRVDDLEADVRNLRSEIAQAHQDTAAARQETQEWRDRYFAEASKLEATQERLAVTQEQLTAALAQIAALKGSGGTA